MLYATTSHTAAELIVARADPAKPNMALTSWRGSRVRTADIVVAKNYLTTEEIDTLNRLVVIFLEQAELRVKQQRDLTLDYWRQNVDKMLSFNDRPILENAGRVSRERIEAVTSERYTQFDAERRKAEAHQADEDDLKALEQLERDIERKKH